ncbi:MAG: COQ9 family protein [Alphaproteobacteria bacterium]
MATPVNADADLAEAVLARLESHLPFDGWSEQSLIRATTDAGLPRGAVWIAFPRGIGDALPACLARHRVMLADRLAAADLAGMRVRDKVALGVRVWLETWPADREALRRTLARLALPGHARLAVADLWSTADVIWRAAGDQASDFNHYTKRGLLVGVLATTRTVWVADDSPGATATWGFLERRIGDALRLPRAAQRLGRIARCLPSPVAFLRRRATARAAARPAGRPADEPV